MGKSNSGLGTGSLAWGLVAAAVDDGMQKFKVFCIHTRPPIDPVRVTKRNALLKKVGVLASVAEMPIMVVGDFNAMPWEPIFSELKKRAQLRDSRFGHGYQASWLSFLPPLLRIPIDHVVHSEQFKVSRRYLGPACGSDHFPVIIEFTLDLPVVGNGIPA